ncbi:MAG: aminotransferase class V-fold PLP-dependent enzyme [Burkholderiales bacterium]|nr:aminotransferase class V-fold PLP-dependent enzyme [Burkholderiales bacterium]
MSNDRAECGNLAKLLQQLGGQLDQYLRFEHADAMQDAKRWRSALEGSLPEQGVGIEQVIEQLGRDLIPNGSQIPYPGCTSFITTGATSVGALVTLAGAVAAPQRIGLTAFSFLEELSLQWLAEMFELPPQMKGVYSSGGSVANLVALGAARQWAFERIGLDPARDGMRLPCRIYATSASHNTIRRAAAVLGMGRSAVVNIPSDAMGRMLPAALRRQLDADSNNGCVPVAIVANAGATSTGAIDPLRRIGEIAGECGIWFHVDGAYGLPGILDERVRSLYDGLALADSVIVDPHKWMGAPVGIGATFVRDRGILNRAFTQGASDYLEGSVTDENIQHSMDSLGVPYSDFGVELSAPSRGAVVWALIREIGKEGMRERVCRHNAMARLVAERAHAHPNLEVVMEPTLSICCFRYVTDDWEDLNELNRRIHRKLVHRGRSIPSTASVNGVLAIRPCFVGARTSWEHVDELIEEVLHAGQDLAASRQGAPYETQQALS